MIFFKLVLFLLAPSFAIGASEPTPVMFADLHTGLKLKNTRPWRGPDYTKQKALGYTVGTFAVPSGMEERVTFWLDIYTKYTADEGLLHDSRNVHIIYEEVDFSDIMKNKKLNLYQKQKARKKRVDVAKKRIKKRLYRLQRLRSSSGLEGEDLRYWVMFNKVNEKNKYIKASKRGRLRFQLGQKNLFLKGIYYSGRYLEQMEKIFKKNGLPIELTRLPFVESSFNYRARSNVGASGIWQFMRGTGRQYLKMNISVDERNDPIEATHASAKMLKKNFEMLGNWPLAVTGYNHGPYGVRRLVSKYKTNNLVELIEIRRGRFGFASANFYASFLAAIEAEKQALKYYGEKVVWSEPIEGETIKLSKNIGIKDLLGFFNGNFERTKLFNLHLRPSVWKGRIAIKSKNFIRVPKESLIQTQKKLSLLKSVPLYKSKIYRVKRGDTLSEIAENFRVGLSKLVRANGHINPHRLRIGQKVYLPK